MTDAPTKDTQSIPVPERIRDYLCSGGLFNPELMDHDKVRDLLVEARDEIDAMTRIIREDVASKEALRMRRMVELCRDTFADFQNVNRMLGRTLQADAARAGYDACVRCLENES